MKLEELNGIELQDLLEYNFYAGAMKVTEKRGERARRKEKHEHKGKDIPGTDGGREGENSFLIQTLIFHVEIAYK